MCDESAAHEASERLFAYLCDINCIFPAFDSAGENTIEKSLPVPLTTGNSAEKDQLVHLLMQACLKVRSDFRQQQTELLKLFFASHLAPPLGLRRDDVGGDNEELDLSIDEDDQCAYEVCLDFYGARLLLHAPL